MLEFAAISLSVPWAVIRHVSDGLVSCSVSIGPCREKNRMTFQEKNHVWYEKEKV